MENRKESEDMKKINQKGFTLIELLAVITIMGILMLVAIPAMQRTIENSRRGTFANVAGTYVNAIKTAVSGDELKCGTNTGTDLPDGYYYYKFDSTAVTGQDLMEQGGKSSWGNSEVKGIIIIKKSTTADNKPKFEYSIIMVDSEGRGIGTGTKTTGVPAATVIEANLNRANVNPKDGTYRKLFYQKFPNPTAGQTKWGNTVIPTGTTITSCSLT